jgi:hypothetical protein
VAGGGGSTRGWGDGVCGRELSQDCGIWLPGSCSGPESPCAVRAPQVNWRPVFWEDTQVGAGQCRGGRCPGTPPPRHVRLPRGSARTLLASAPQAALPIIREYLAEADVIKLSDADLEALLGVRLATALINPAAVGPQRHGPAGWRIGMALEGRELSQASPPVRHAKRP